MAVTAFTKRQVVADLFPEFLTRRSQPFAPLADAYAKEVGLTRLAVVNLTGSMALWDSDLLTRARSRWRSPYVTEEGPRENAWREVVQAGLAEDVGEGWRIMPRGREVAEGYQRRFRAYLSGLMLPTDATERAATELAGLAARVPPSAERTRLVRELPMPPASEPPSAAIRLNRAVNELWSFRDDCHIAAWEAAGYNGPTLDVLTQVWSAPTDLIWATQGDKRTVDEIAKAIGAKQERLDVERNVDELVRRCDLARDGDAVRIMPQGQRSRDAIEEDTDRRYFAIWDLDDAATSRLGDDLRTVIDALPKA